MNTQRNTLSNPLVSIIVPVFNSEDYIERCIKSILNQTYPTIELILINDGSTDSSLSILDKLSKIDNRIIVINKENEGVSSARNLGIESSSGKYIMFIDNDDFVDDNYVETYVSEVEKNKADLIIGGYKRVNQDKILFKDYPRDSKWGKYVILSPWSKIYKKDIIVSNGIKFLNYPIGEDIYFNLQFFKYAKKIVAIKNFNYHWFFNGKSISNTSQRGFNDKINITYFLNKLLSIAPQNEQIYLSYFIKRYYVWYLLFNGRNSDYERFIYEHEKIVKWLKLNNFKLNVNPLSKRFRGEGYKNRIIVLAFSILERLNLIKIFSRIYCKKKVN